MPPPIENSTQAEIRIEPPAQFGFDWCHEFRQRCKPAGSGTRFILDLSHTQSIESAALGMLLQLEERAGADAQRLKIVHASQDLLPLLETAGLGPYIA